MKDEITFKIVRVIIKTFSQNIFKDITALHTQININEVLILLHTKIS